MTNTRCVLCGNPTNKKQDVGVVIIAVGFKHVEARAHRSCMDKVK